MVNNIGVSHKAYSKDFANLKISYYERGRKGPDLQTFLRAPMLLLRAWFYLITMRAFESIGYVVSACVIVES